RGIRGARADRAWAAHTREPARRPPLARPYRSGARGGVRSGTTTTKPRRLVIMRRPTWIRAPLWPISLPLLMSAPGSGQSPSSPPSARRPEIWAIVVGVGEYEDPRLLDSPAAARNADNVVQWIRRAGTDRRHQLWLRDYGNEDPGTPDAPALSIR